MVKLPFFPEPTEGETLYSLCARFHRRSGYARPEYSSNVMLGHPRGGSRPDILTGLRHLEAASGNLIEATESTLRTRTVLRAYLPFMSAPRRREVFAAVAASNRTTSRCAAGLPWNDVVLRHELRCCPECSLEDRSRYGVACWKVDHQLPGVWICSDHGWPLLVQAKRGARNSNWVTVQDAKLIDPLPRPTPQILAQLKSIASAVLWIGSQTALNVDALSSMMRLRLRMQSAIACELKCTKAELESIHSDRVSRVVNSGLSHFRSFQDWTWLRHTLFDRRYAHPLRWALALAISGSTEHSDLSRDYYEALGREPQYSLFPDTPEPLRALAPNALYRALDGPVSIKEAARACGLRQGEIERWLRRDASLSTAWKASTYQVKRRAAVMLVQGVLLAHHDASRTLLLKNARWAFRWLERNERDLLDALAPAPYGRRTQGLLWS
ncbi:TniQ family protein [Ramlibacter sp. AN1015]|uniref:TniQ family protein n=1 Tax=Ramlibacter sp. AN1015 TaxID=3133428 RepID=UPI0040409702